MWLRSVGVQGVNRNAGGGLVFEFEQAIGCAKRRCRGCRRGARRLTLVAQCIDMLPREDSGMSFHRAAVGQRWVWKWSARRGNGEADAMKGAEDNGVAVARGDYPKLSHPSPCSMLTAVDGRSLMLTRSTSV